MLRASALLPATNKRNQLDVLGCSPRDFHRGKERRNQREEESEAE